MFFHQQDKRIIRKLSPLFLLVIVILLSACQVDTLSQQIGLARSSSQGVSQTHSSQIPSQSDAVFAQATIDAKLKLREFQAILHVMQTNGDDTTTYQLDLNADTTALQSAKTVSAVNTVSGQITSQMQPDQFSLAKALAQYLVAQFHQDVTAWGNSHQFHDSYDGKTYPLDFEYGITPQYYTQYDYGEGAQINALLGAAATLSDYQNVVSQAQADETLLQAMESDASDATPWDQAHATDQQIMQYYHVTTGQTLVVSFYEQVVRLYQDGKLITAYQVSTGQYYRPTILGLYQIVSHQAQSEFTSFEDTSSPLYFPSMTIQDAMGFGDPSAGYFFHASPWRTVYGMNTEFPHNDSDNENSESRNGSHGCVNLPLSAAQWLFNQVQDGANVVLY